MEIRIGSYILHGDGNCYWIDCEVVSQNGKARLKRVTGYYPNLTGLFKSFVDRKLRGDGIVEMKDFLELACRTREELIKLAERVGTELDTKLAEHRARSDGATGKLAEHRARSKNGKGQGDAK